MKKVFLGVGHGGTDPGAVSGTYLEKNLNLPIALACRDLLERSGVEVLLSRSKDENDTLEEEIRECNAFHPDLAIDIHNNAGGGDGAEAFYHYKGGDSKTLAENILSSIVSIGQNSRGAKVKLNSSGRDYYGFIRETVAPAVIVECAFLDNPSDVTIVSTLERQVAMGQAIARGILKTMGISPVEEPIPSEEPVPAPAPQNPSVEPTPAPAPAPQKPSEETEMIDFFHRNRTILKEAINRFFRWLDQ